MDTLAGIRVNRYAIFRVFKYTVYLLLVYNIHAFFVENHAAAGHVFADGVRLDKIIEAYNEAIDTLAWVLLLLVFELETYVLADEKIHGWVKWTLTGVSAISYAFIVYAFYGYVREMAALTHLLPLTQSPCELAAAGNWSLALGQDEYAKLTAQNCTQLAEGQVLRLADAQVLGEASVWRDIKWLSWADVINSGTWLLVVSILAFDVWLQMRHELSRSLLRYSEVIKGVLYFILLLCAIYWGINGSFLDFWDAFLWLVAFFFIELNLFEWQAETSAENRRRRGRNR